MYLIINDTQYRFPLKRCSNSFFIVCFAILNFGQRYNVVFGKGTIVLA